MKHFLLLFFTISLPLFSFSQENKPPKLRYSAGFFSAKWEIGDKDASIKDVRSHLEKHSAEAYHVWKKSESNSAISVVLGIVSIGGLVVGLVSDDENTQLIGYGVCIGAGVVSITSALVSGGQSQKAMNIYNKKFGY